MTSSAMVLGRRLGGGSLDCEIYWQKTRKVLHVKLHLLLKLAYLIVFMHSYSTICYFHWNLTLCAKGKGPHKDSVGERSEADCRGSGITF